MFELGSPAKDASGTGASAVAIYNLKKRPYTVSIIMRDNTQMKRLPKSVTIHKGILSQNPTLLIAVMTSAGNAVAPPVRDSPDDVIMVEIAPWAIPNMASMMSIHQDTVAFASTNRMNNLKACSGRLISVKFH